MEKIGCMDFSLKRINRANMQYSDSGTESDIQLIFAPGGFNTGLWKHQLRYFSKKYRTICFRPTESNRGFKGEKRCIKAILDRDDVDNAVLVSNGFGNSIVREMSSHEAVQTTVMTGFRPEMPGRSFYNAFSFMAKRKPKLLRKTLFSQYTDYRVLKNFVEDLEVPDYETVSSFTKKDMVSGDELSLIIHAEEDRFSSIEDARKLNARLSVIERAGTFCFYEKPQEYNKALSDFLEIVVEKVREEMIKQSAEENRSLIEFDDKKVKATE
jgi:pimeloyl-ACP methyl ester carboxylesterase